MRNLEAHRHIRDALRARDADEAERRMRWHLADFRRGFELAGFRLGDAARWPADSLPAVQRTEETLS
jgi:hypothetical protein